MPKPQGHDRRRSPRHALSLTTALALTASGIGMAWAAPATPAASPAGLSDPNAIRVLLVAGLETTMFAQMNGTLVDLRVALGQKVARNAVLVQLNCGEIQARADVARAELAMAKQNLVGKKGLQELNAAGEIEVGLARTDVEKAEGALALSRVQLGYCKVQAPFNGRVAKVYIKPFQTVSAGTPLFDIVGDGVLKARLNVPSVLLRRLKVGQPFEITIQETGKTYPSRVAAINARVDAVAQTVELEARLDAEHPELSAGMSGVARFPDAQ